MRKHVIGLGVVALVFAAGCAGSSSVDPTTRPTEAPVAVVEDEGTPWLVFSAAIQSRLPELTDAMERGAGAAAAEDIDGVIDAMAELSALAAEDEDWLEEHLPQACYADVHRSLIHAMVLYQGAGRHATDSEFSSATTTLDAANDQLAATTDLLKTVRCD